MSNPEGIELGEVSQERPELAQDEEAPLCPAVDQAQDSLDSLSLGEVQEPVATPATGDQPTLEEIAPKLTDAEYIERMKFAATVLASEADDHISEPDDFSLSLTFCDQLEATLIGDKWKTDPGLLDEISEFYAYLLYSGTRGDKLLKLLDIENPRKTYDSLKATPERRREAILTVAERMVLSGKPEILQAIYLRSKCLLRLMLGQDGADSFLHTLVFMELGSDAVKQMYHDYSGSGPLAIGNDWQRLAYFTGLVEAHDSHVALVSEILVRAHRKNLYELEKSVGTHVLHHLPPMAWRYLEWARDHVRTQSRVLCSVRPRAPETTTHTILAMNLRNLGDLNRTDANLMVCSVMWVALARVLSFDLPMLDFGRWPKGTRNSASNMQEFVYQLSRDSERGPRSYLMVNLLLGQVSVWSWLATTLSKFRVAFESSFRLMLAIYGILDMWQPTESGGILRAVHGIIYQALSSDAVHMRSLDAALKQRDTDPEVDKLAETITDEARQMFLVKQICGLAFNLPIQVWNASNDDENKSLRSDFAKWVDFAQDHADTILEAFAPAEQLQLVQQITPTAVFTQSEASSTPEQASEPQPSESVITNSVDRPVCGPVRVE